MRRAAGIVAAGGILILVAFAFAASELLVPGVGFVLLGTGAAAWMSAAARAVKLRRSVDADRVVEDQPLEVRIEVRGGPLGLPGAAILNSMAGTTIRLSPSPGRLALRGTEVRVVGRFSRRGRQRLEPPAVALADPLGLVRIARPGGVAAQSVLVLPRTEPVRWLSAEGGDRLDRQSGAANLDMLAALEVDGLRPYRPGTPASRISWSALARGAGLLERRLRAERDSGPLVVLDVRSDGPSEEIDAAVRAAASLTLELARRSGCELLLPGERRPLAVEADLGAWPGAHARLALVAGGPEAPAPWPASGTRCGAIFYVAAQPTRLPRPLLHAGQGGFVLVLPAARPPGRRALPRFEVSGCRGYQVAEGGPLSVARARVA